MPDSFNCVLSVSRGSESHMHSAAEKYNRTPTDGDGDGDEQDPKLSGEDWLRFIDEYCWV